MKYIVIDQTLTDWFTGEYDSLDEALKSAEFTWNKMSKFDRKRRVAFYVLKSENPDEEAENHLDGSVVREWK